LLGGIKGIFIHAFLFTTTCNEEGATEERSTGFS